MIFLLHDEVHICQSAMRMIAQVAAVMSVFRYNWQSELVRLLIKPFATFVTSTSPNEKEQRTATRSS
jgi:hypothetical protein